MTLSPYALLLIGTLAVLTACQKRLPLEPLNSLISDFEGKMEGMRLDSSSPIVKSTFADYQRNIYKGKQGCISEYEAIVRDGKIYRMAFSMSSTCDAFQARNLKELNVVQIEFAMAVMGFLQTSQGWKTEQEAVEKMVEHDLNAKLRLCTDAVWAGEKAGVAVTAEDVSLSCGRQGTKISVVIQKSSTLTASRAARVHGEVE